MRYANTRTKMITVYTYSKKRCRGERRLDDRNELWVPFGMQNFTSCVAHAYVWVASENQALQLAYPFSSKGNATSEILHTKWYPQFISVATSVLPDNVY